MRIVFMGTPDFSVPSLSALIAQGHEIVAVYTRAPKAAGRGMAEKRSPVHELADRFGLAVHTPKSLRSAEAAALFASHAADVAVVVACCPKPFSMRRNLAASICMARCCRAGAAPRPFSGP